MTPRNYFTQLSPPTPTPGTCSNPGCADLACQLCSLTQARRCDGHFAHKYFAPQRNRLPSGEVLAGCGAPIDVILVDDVTGEPEEGVDTFLLVSAARRAACRGCVFVCFVCVLQGAAHLPRAAHLR